jgi:peroxiredoxin
MRCLGWRVVLYLLGAGVLAWGQEVGEPAPELLVPDKERSKELVSLFERYPNRILVLYYWSSTNSRSLEFFKRLNELHDKYNPRGVTIVALAVEREEKVKKVREEYQPKFELIWQEGGIPRLSWLHTKWRFPAPPLAYIIDKYGRVAYARFDPEDGLEEKIQAVLERTPTAAATEERLRTSFERVSEYLKNGEVGRAFRLATELEDCLRNTDEARRERVEQLMKQVRAAAQTQLEAALTDIKNENYEAAARKLADLSVNLQVRKDKDAARRGSSSRTRQAPRPAGPARPGQPADTTPEPKQISEIKEQVEQEIGRLQGDAYTKAIILKALDHARGEKKNDQAAELLEAGYYFDARELYRLVTQQYAGTEASAKAQAAIDRINNDPKMREKIRADQAAEQALRWLDIADRCARLEMFDMAREYYQKVIAGFPDSAAAQKARAGLDRLPELERKAGRKAGAGAGSKSDREK